MQSAPLKVRRCPRVSMCRVARQRSMPWRNSLRRCWVSGAGDRGPGAQARKQLNVAQRDIAATMGVSIARISPIEHGDVISFEVIARYVEALGGRLDLVAGFGDRTVHLPVSDTAETTAA